MPFVVFFDSSADPCYLPLDSSRKIESDSMRSLNPESFENRENFIIVTTSFAISFYELLFVSRKMGIASRRSVKLVPLVLLVILIILPPFGFFISLT